MSRYDIGANLDQSWAAVGIAGEEVHFKAVAGANVIYFATPTFKFEQDDGFEGVTEERRTSFFQPRNWLEWNLITGVLETLSCVF